MDRFTPATPGALNLDAPFIQQQDQAALVEPCILAGSKEGDTVLDPLRAQARPEPWRCAITVSLCHGPGVNSAIALLLFRVLPVPLPCVIYRGPAGRSPPAPAHGDVAALVVLILDQLMLRGHGDGGHLEPADLLSRAITYWRS
jgi:hypothetical protein